MYQLLVKSNDTETAKRYCRERFIRVAQAYELSPGEQIIVTDSQARLLRRWYAEGRSDAPFAYGTLLHFSELPHVDEDAPTVKVNGVEWAIRYGEGLTLERTPWGTREWCPVYVWCAVAWPEFTAPKHVSDECNRAYELGCEVATAERAAGWPSA